MALGGAQSQDGMIDFRGLKEWILDQERYQLHTSRPAPLNTAQKEAMALLQIKPEPVSEPDMDETDWTSLLKNYLDLHPLLTVRYWEDRTKDNRFIGRCEVSHSDQGRLFPAVNGKLSGDTRPQPSFARKKEAKQWASKCAFEALAMPKRTASSPSVNSPVWSPPTSPGGATLSPPPPTLAAHGHAQSSDEEPGDGPQVPVTKQVAVLCEKLGYNVPQYRIEPTAEAGSQGALDGRLDFGTTAAGVPKGLGAVDCVYGKKNIRRLMAEQALRWLQSVAAERSDTFDQLRTASSTPSISHEIHPSASVEEFRKKKESVS